MTIWPPIACVLLIAFNATLYFQSERQRHVVTQDAQIRAENTAILVETSVSEFIESSQRTLTGVAQLLTVTQAMSEPPRPEVVATMAERRGSTPSLSAILAVDALGNLRVHSETRPFQIGNVADRPYFIYHRDTPGFAPLLGAPIRSRASGAWVIPLSRRLEYTDGRFAGVMITTLTPLHFVQLFQDLVGDERVVITLRHSDGSVIASHPDLATPDAIAAPDVSNGFLSARRSSARYPLTVEVSINLKRELAPWRQERNLTAVLALCGSVVIVIGAFALHRLSRRRRHVLLDLAEANAFLEQRVEERTTELQGAFDRLRGFLAVARDAVVVIDSRGLIVEFNPAAQLLFGYDSSEVAGHSINMLMPKNYAVSHDSHLARSHITQPPHKIGQGREMIGVHKDGHEFPIELTVGTHRDGESFTHVGVIRDISERKLAEERLTLLATTDGLTGLLNRRAFLEQAVQRFADSDGRQLAVLMVDADHFKHVNDTYGHATGDRVLCQLAKILRECARGSDISGRLGGEEFALVLAKASVSAAQRVADQILEQVRASQMNADDGTAFGFRVSVGIAVGTRADNPEQLLSQADAALYQAKSQGRDRAVLATTAKSADGSEGDEVLHGGDASLGANVIRLAAGGPRHANTSDQGAGRLDLHPTTDNGGTGDVS